MIVPPTYTSYYDPPSPKRKKLKEAWTKYYKAIGLYGFKLNHKVSMRVNKGIMPNKSHKYFKP